MAQGELLGMLHVQISATEVMPAALRDSRPGARRSWVLAPAEHVSLALGNLKLRESLAKQPVRDPLTGLYNRRHMEHALEREVLRRARAARSA